MPKIITYLFLASFFAIIGCSSPSNISRHYDVPVDYMENKATVLDSFQNYSLSGSEFFVVTGIDGKYVDNAYDRTFNRPNLETAMGIQLGYRRYIPNRDVKLLLAAANTAPIISFNGNTANSLAAEINFRPAKDQIYQVNGFISPSYVALWLEDLSGKIVSVVAERSSAYYDRTVMHKMLDYQGRYSDKKRTDAERFLSLRGGDTKDILIKKLGMPTREEIVPSKRRNFHRVSYHYEGLGSVVFGNQLGGSHEFTAYIKPDFSSISFDEALNTTNPVMRQAFARYYINEGELSEKNLDKIAASLWLWRKSDNVNVVESNALFCRILAKSGNRIYRAILEAISEDSEIDKLKRHAQTSLESLKLAEEKPANL